MVSYFAGQANTHKYRNTTYKHNIGEQKSQMSVRIKVESLQTAWRVKDTYIYDGFMGMITEGKQRTGKSSYNCQSLAEAFGRWEFEEGADGYHHAMCVAPDYEEVKKWVVFPPRQFLDKVFGVPEGKKEMALYWSDAGFWLFVLDWYEPFVKSVAKYIQLIGRQFGTILFSTPNKNLISSKVLDSMPEIYVCRISKKGYDRPRVRKRLAKIYERWDYPDGKKGGVKTRWQDKFNAMLPDPFFKWYQPISEHYLKIGQRILQREVAALQKKQKLKGKEKEEQVEDVAKVVGSPERLSEIQEVLKQYGV